MVQGALWAAFVYLAAAVAGVLVAKRAGMGSVLGYLLAGIVIGPFGLGLVGREGHEVMHFAELGVVMMLFLVGLELRPALLWQLRRSVLGLGGAQVVLTTAVVSGAAVALGVDWRAALAVGMTLAMSSTAIVLQSLTEKSLLKTPGGQAAFSVLLFQDIAVIPILAIFPTLAVAPAAHGEAASRPAWEQAALIVGAVALVVVVGRFVVRPAFRYLAKSRLRETFTAAALLLVIGTALLMEAVDLSPALGTFLAGVVLAESEYRHELESDIEPFKGLLLGVFFISVGAQIDFALIAARPLPIVGIVAAAIAAKLAVLYGVARVFHLDRPARWLLAFSLAQVGEFAFVLLSFGAQSRIFDAGTEKLLVAVVALSMAATPALFIVLERVVLPHLLRTAPARAQDVVVHDGNPVIIAGHGRFGQIVGRMLRASGFGTTVLDLDPDMVDVLRRLGVKVYYGDASRPELLERAGCRDAKLFILAVDDQAVALQIAETVKRKFPGLRILGRARGRAEYYEMTEAGVDLVFRETFGSAFEMGIEALERLGYEPAKAERVARRWRRYEEHALTELSELRGGDETVYFAAAKRMLEETERLMREGDVREEREPGAG